MSKFVRAISVAAVALAICPTFAAAFEGTAVGSWGNVVNGNVYTITNSDAGSVASFDFGSGSPTNLFTFDGAGSDGDPGWSGGVGDVFRVGDFSYRNGATSAGTSFTGTDAAGNSYGGVTLSIALHISNPIVVDETFSFPFDVTLTSNTTGDPVSDGDIVLVLEGITTASFAFGGNNYTLQLLGFSTDSGISITTAFNSPENSTANAGVYGRITAAVPEPGSIGLIGLGLAGLIASRRRRH